VRIEAPMPLFAYATVGDPGPMPFDLNLSGLQNGVLLYLGLSSLVFMVLWIVGYVRRSGVGSPSSKTRSSCCTGDSSLMKP